MIIITWIIIAILSWGAYSLFKNLKDSKKFVDNVYSEPKDNIPSTYLLAIRNMSEKHPFLKQYTREIGGIIVFSIKTSQLPRLLSVSCSFTQVICVAIFIFSLIKIYPIQLIWSLIFFFIFGYLGSRFNKKAMIKEMSKMFALKLEKSKDQEIRQKYENLLENYHQILDKESAKYKN